MPDEPERKIPTRRWLGPAASEILDALYPGLLPDDPGIPYTPDATVLVECCYCDTQLEVVTGEAWDARVMAAGWEIDGAGDLVCPRCTAAREELIGGERC